MASSRSRGKPKAVAIRAVWKRGNVDTYAGIKARDAYEELERLRSEGQSDPHGIVESARDRKSPLHTWFDWDDATAAQSHRLQQARQLVTSIRVVFMRNKKEHVAPAFVSIEFSEEGNGVTHHREYVPTIRAVNDPSMRRQMLEEAASDLQSWRNRYEHLNEFSRVFRAERQVRKELGIK